LRCSAEGWAVGSCWLQTAGVEFVGGGVEGAFAARVWKLAALSGEDLGLLIFRQLGFGFGPALRFFYVDSGRPGRRFSYKLMVHVVNCSSKEKINLMPCLLFKVLKVRPEPTPEWSDGLYS
jgi:hypothetical protein